MGSYPQADGSDCELVDAEDDQVYVKRSDASAGFQLASVTINGMRQRLNEATNLALRFVPVN
ncbi:MAG TPA: NifU family protein [Pseudaminobacter sp.]|nr:NifU family protein [Pseudaminobacter sp.]